MAHAENSPAGDVVAPSTFPIEQRGEARTREAVVLTEGELQDLLGMQAQIPGDSARLEAFKEHRHDQRMKLRLPLEAILLDEPGPPSVRIKLRDTSPRGMGFFSRHSFKVGDRYVVRFHFANAEDRLVLYHVHHCAAMRGDWHQGGAEFVDAVSIRGLDMKIPSRWARGSG